MAALVLLLVAIALNSVGAQTATNLLVEKYEMCGSGADDEIKFYMVPKNFHKGLQLFDANFSLPFSAGPNVLTKVTLYTQISSAWVPLFAFEDKQGLCHAFDAYLGEIAYAVERAAGLPPKICPIPKGVYHAYGFTLDFKRLKLQSLPFGKVKAKIEGRTKDTKKAVLCAALYLGNDQ